MSEETLATHTGRMHNFEIKAGILDARVHVLLGIPLFFSPQPLIKRHYKFWNLQVELKSKKHKRKHCLLWVFDVLGRSKAYLSNSGVCQLRSPKVLERHSCVGCGHLIHQAKHSPLLKMCLFKTYFWFLLWFYHLLLVFLNHQGLKGLNHSSLSKTTKLNSLFSMLETKSLYNWNNNLYSRRERCDESFHLNVEKISNDVQMLICKNNKGLNLHK